MVALQAATAIYEVAVVEENLETNMRDVAIYDPIFQLDLSWVRMHLLSLQLFKGPMLLPYLCVS